MATNIPFRSAFEITTEGLYTIVAKNSRGVSTFTQQGSIACWSESQRSWSRERLKTIGRTVAGAVRVTIGEKGARSLTFSGGSEECIKRNLPAEGSVASLPEGFGDVVIDRAACQASPSLPAVFNNALLGNTLAMALSFIDEEDLPYAPICPTMIAEGLAAGRPWHGNEKDQVKLSLSSAALSQLFNQCDSAGPHIPRHGRACGSIHIPDQARYTYIVVTLYGSDDQGKGVRVASRRLYFF